MSIDSEDSLTYERANFLFRYDPVDGKLYWKNKTAPRSNRIVIGQEVGNVFCGGRYLQTSVDQRKYLIHRIIWMMHYGKFPSFQIDHIDGDGLNNRISNLRDVPDLDNKRNMSRRIDNKSGITGISWHRKGKKWVVQIQDKGEHVYLGLFSSIEEAAIARRNAEERIGFLDNDRR